MPTKKKKLISPLKSTTYAQTPHSPQKTYCKTPLYCCTITPCLKNMTIRTAPVFRSFWLFAREGPRGAPASFDLFFTLKEKKVLGRRYLIVKALEEGKLTQRQIAKKFKVSIAQITRGSNALKIIDTALRKLLKAQAHFSIPLVCTWWALAQ